MELNRHGASGAELQVQHFNEDREGHREVDVPFRDVIVEPVGDQRKADHQKERKCQHLYRGVFVDEFTYRPGEYQHEDHGNYDSGDHYLYL